MKRESWLLSGIFALMLAAPCLAVEPPAEIAGLVAQLDHAEFAMRHKAHARLLEIGQPAMPALLKARSSASSEQRYRVERLVEDIRRTGLLAGFAKIARAKRDADIDLEQGMWLISRIINPLADRKKLTRELDVMAAKVRKRLAGKAAAEVSAEQFAEALVQVLKLEYGLRGNTEDYNHPNNSSLEKVLATKKGLPILLSHIAIAVAERLDAQVDGLGMPGRYMIRHRGLVIDPYGGWKTFPPSVNSRALPGFRSAQDLEPYTRRASLQRMLRNLDADFLQRGETARAEEVRRYEGLLKPVTLPDK